MTSNENSDYLPSSRSDTLQRKKYCKIAAVVLSIFIGSVIIERTVHYVELKDSELANSKGGEGNGHLGHYGMVDIGTSQDEFDFDDFAFDDDKAAKDFAYYFRHDDDSGDRSNMIYCVGGSDNTEQFVYHYSTYEKAKNDYEFYSEELGFNVLLRKLDEDPGKTIETFGTFEDIRFLEHMCDTEA